MNPRSSPFSPRRLEPALLDRLTVAREPLLTRLVSNLSAALLSGQGRFDLLVGPAGVGKSHMLGLVEARVRASDALRERVIAVALPEEFHPSSLLHLLARVLEGLPERPSLPPVEAQLRALRGRDASEAIDMVVAMIRARLGDRSLLLMLENLDAVFDDLGRKAQAQLRKIVQTEQGWSMFATARSSIALTRQTEPFHGTFVVEALDSLTPSQSREMLLALARVHEQPELGRWLGSEDALVQIRAAHHLVGGSPRAMAMLFHHLDVEQLDDFEGAFYRLAEELTPYFQAQMSQLSAGQRPIMEFLAERWVPASVTEIADATFNAPTTVSTHLRALRRERRVHSLAVGKERLYEISEPLHRIAQTMQRNRRLGAEIARLARVWAQVELASVEHGSAPTQIKLRAWLRREPERLVEPDIVIIEESPILRWCETLEHVVQSPTTTSSAALREAIQFSNVCIPLWIASGRDIGALHRVLREHANDLNPGLAFEHALATQDSARAFARLGAESRAFARELLSDLALSDLIETLPAEPSPDPV